MPGFRQHRRIRKRLWHDALMDSNLKSARMTAGERIARLKTCDRILIKSIELFNEVGVQHVTIEQIANAMKISNGNLSYHFRRKRDLLRATLPLLQARICPALTQDLTTREPLHGAEKLREILGALWDFRFFFNALTYLLSKDDVLRKEYFGFQEWAIDTLDQGLQQMVETGQLSPLREPNNTRLLAENMWCQWLNWLRMQQIHNPSVRVPEKQALYDCSLHHWSLLEPYFSESFAKGLLPAYQRLMLSPDHPERPKVFRVSTTMPAPRRRKASGEK
ncbi:MAG: TetR/AcrR family transcriptional regulator [Pseudomonadota bacterium]|nr:TetR/AcrR family transcriptional regulator [Pseudomonadota bacterium]